MPENETPQERMLRETNLKDAEDLIEKTGEQLGHSKDFSNEKWEGTLDYLTKTIENIENMEAQGLLTEEQKEGVKPVLEDLKKQRFDVTALVSAFEAEEKTGKKES